ncbi:MAG TPA: hypothetical protein VK862_20505, partial [Afifellaceae bacterium]|nr:hypothetical protein [Afifellaceae bacterium]
GLPVEPVRAQGLFNRLFDELRYDYRDRNRVRRYNAPGREWRTKRRIKQRSARTVRVKSPRYYTYKPDALITASLASLAEPTGGDVDQAFVASPFEEAREHLASFRIRTLPEVAAAIKAHYSEDPRFIWVTDGRPNAKASAALARLETADAFGLSSGDSVVDLPATGFGAAGGAESSTSLVEFEMDL